LWLLVARGPLQRVGRVEFAERALTGGITVTRGGKTITPSASGLKPSNHAVLRAAFSKKLGRGTYKVSWHALADNGHHEEGSWAFSVR
jgi:methionine-rich copper-binding protein CopC